MAILFENNGDWPDSDEDYRKIDDKEDSCFFCNRIDNCICDYSHDIQNEEKDE